MHTESSLIEVLNNNAQKEEQLHESTIVLDGEEYLLQITQKTIFLSATNPDHKDHYFFRSYLDDAGILELHISTRHPENDSRAPGLYAYELVGIALNYFKRKQKDVNAIRGHWTKDRYSDNYVQYMQKIRSGSTPIQAAKETWTGKASARYGYTKVSFEDETKVAFNFLFSKE